MCSTISIAVSRGERSGKANCLKGGTNIMEKRSFAHWILKSPIGMNGLLVDLPP